MQGTDFNVLVSTNLIAKPLMKISTYFLKKTVV